MVVQYPQLGSRSLEVDRLNIRNPFDLGGSTQQIAIESLFAGKVVLGAGNDQ